MSDPVTASPEPTDRENIAIEVWRLVRPDIKYDELLGDMRAGDFPEILTVADYILARERAIIERCIEACEGEEAVSMALATDEMNRRAAEAIKGREPRFGRRPDADRAARPDQESE